MPIKGLNLNKARPPKATRKKVLIHTFYLVQPFVQFFALIAVMLILARCSPLASSTDRPAFKAAHTDGIGTEQAEATAREELILKNMRDLGSAELEVVSHTQLSDLAEETPQLTESLEEAQIKDHFSKREKRSVRVIRKHGKVLFIPLAKDKQDALWSGEVVRLDLSAMMHPGTKNKARRFLFQRLANAAREKDLGGAAYLSVPDATMQRVQGGFDELSLKIRFSLSVPADDLAFLEIQRVSDDSAQSDSNAALLDSALGEADQLAILLE